MRVWIRRGAHLRRKAAASDTNVLSEPSERAPVPVALGWLARQARRHLLLTTIGIAELLMGVALLRATATL